MTRSKTQAAMNITVARNVSKKMRAIVILVLTSLWFNVSGQNSPGQKRKDNSVDTTKTISYKMKYPPDARRKGIQGTVKIKATFDSQCNIVKREVVKSLGFGCDEEALIALTHLEKRIKEVKENRCAEGEEITYPFEFRLD